LVGAVDYSLAQPIYQEHASRYEKWVANQSHDQMKYLERGLDRRLNPKLVFPELEGVIAVARPYAAQPVGSSAPGEVRYARYLNGIDYHENMKQDLERTMEQLKSTLQFPENFSYKVCVDTSAVLERTWAVLTGLGWIGKNTLLIHPQLGSYLFLGVIFTNAKFEKSPTRLKDYCGNCTRCLQSCPTQAFTEPHYLESKKCISYLTLEKRGTWEQKIDTKGFVAGCDICQEVCPYNTKAAKSAESEESAAYLVKDLTILSKETPEEYQKRVAGTALSRVKYDDFQRNLKAVISSTEV